MVVEFPEVVVVDDPGWEVVVVPVPSPVRVVVVDAGWAVIDVLVLPPRSPGLSTAVVVGGALPAAAAGLD